MKVVVIGAAGQLGSALLRAFAERGKDQVLGLRHEDLDILDATAVKQALESHRPDVVINTAAYLQVDAAEDHADDAFRLNAGAAHQLALLAKQLDFTLCQLSTDYVYGLERTRNTPYTEADAPGPVGVYGLSKLAGEYLVRTHAPRHFVIRSAGLYETIGSRKKGGNFIETMLKLAAAKKTLKVVDDQRSTPTFARDLAAAMVELLQTQAYGVYHITNSGHCSWHEMAAEIFLQAGVSADLHKTTAAAWGAKAERPAYSVLSNQKLHALGVVPLRPWQDALSAYLRARA